MTRHDGKALIRPRRLRPGDLDFGHTQPMLTLPYGAMARIDCAAASLTIMESGVTP